MAAKPENNYRNKIHKHLPDSIYHMKNNNAYIAGVPDDWYSGKKADLWVEWKYVDPLPVSVPVRVNKLLSALQLDWLTRRHAEGRKVAVIIGCKTGGVVLTDPKSWNSEILIQDFKGLIRSNVDLAAWIKEQVE